MISINSVHIYLIKASQIVTPKLNKIGIFNPAKGEGVADIEAKLLSEK